MNKITLSGTITKAPSYSHEFSGEKFYELELTVERQSGTIDALNVLVSETFLDGIADQIKVVGEIRTKNIDGAEGERHLQIFVFAKKILPYDGYDESVVEMDGYICKEPRYRETPLGREVADILVACNRAYGKSDYIPTIAWGRNARRAGCMSVGTHILITGRLQSREYTKTFADGLQVTKVAYELSASKIEEIKGEKENE